MSEAICVKIHGADFILEKQKIQEIADGSRKMWAVTDELKRYSLIVSSDTTGKMIQLKPLIRNFKEYKISVDDLFNNPSGFFQIPEQDAQTSQDLERNNSPLFIVVEPEPPSYINHLPPPRIPPRKFLSDEARRSLTEKFGDGKTDDHLQFLQQQEIDFENKKILLETELGIIDPDHSRSFDLLEDMISTKKFLIKVIGEEYIDNLNSSEYEDLYGFYHELQDSMKSDDWIHYKLTKLMKRRRELGSQKNLRELDAFLLNQYSH
jgi:hypothetical protein